MQASKRNLLDALPRTALDRFAAQLREVYVGLEGGKFILSASRAAHAAIEQYFREQGIALPEGQQAEACLDGCGWIENAGHSLGRGFVMTIDTAMKRALYTMNGATEGRCWLIATTGSRKTFSTRRGNRT